jgi:hypothetical protein
MAMFGTWSSGCLIVSVRTARLMLGRSKVSSLLNLDGGVRAG